jgi:hypothetical protein
MDLTLWVSAALMAAGGVLALVVRPQVRAVPVAIEAEDRPSELAA